MWKRVGAAAVLAATFAVAQVAPPPAGAPAIVLPAATAPAGFTPPAELLLDLGNGITLKLIYIAPGDFLMGAGPGEAKPHKGVDETRHKVTLTRGYYIGATEITRGQWKRIMGDVMELDHVRTDDMPVSSLTWYDAAAFCRRLGTITGTRCRLPTEAEWEYACRAGTTTEYNTGKGKAALEEAAWYEANATGQPIRGEHPVATKKPNAWGLYDMHGNVQEWVQDRMEKFTRDDAVDPAGATKGNAHVVKGGHWAGGLAECRSASRLSFDHTMAHGATGVRVVVDVDPGVSPLWRKKRIAELLAVVKENDNKEKGKVALEALDEVLSLEWSHAEARRLIDKINGYYIDAEIARFKFVKIKAGTFTMGSDKSGAPFESEHEVQLTRGFSMSTLEVTQSLWRSVMGYNPSMRKGDDLPVDFVSWDEAVAFCKKLSARTKKNYRLPTDAEWEYACRAGSRTAFAAGEFDEAARMEGWFASPLDAEEARVRVGGQKLPNAWGLFDMHGNVAEWCSDWYYEYGKQKMVDPKGPATGTGRIFRGGSTFSTSRMGRASGPRFKGTPSTPYLGVGIRLVIDE